MSTYRLADLAWPEVARRAADGAILAVPVGATEQHGPHLPLSTDTDIAEALCRRLAAARADVVVAPPVGYGSSGEHAGFAGTLSIGQEVVASLVVELVRSASQTFGAVVVVSAHGGNAGPVGRAVEQLRAEGHDVLLFSPTWVGDPHAGAAETALMLAIDASRVDMTKAAAGDPRPLAAVLPLLVTSGVAAVSPTGVLGDPTTADAPTGAMLLEQLVTSLADAVDRWRAAVQVGAGA